MQESCQRKQQKIVDRFAACASDQERYSTIIEMGRALPPYPQERKIQEHLVGGCQSQTYLFAQRQEQNVIFAAASDALISAGLTALLISVYSEELPTTILNYPPHFIDALKLTRYLTPSRSNGLFSVHLRMKRDAIGFLAEDLRRSS